jgi:hypothetical protein
MPGARADHRFLLAAHPDLAVELERVLSEVGALPSVDADATT